ncbi:hypothetical protein J3A83DRAFT_4205234 [Scleroderma citrinum]
MSWFHHHRESSPLPPPEWAPAPEQSHMCGLFNEASEYQFAAAERFCSTYPPDQPRILDSRVVDDIRSQKGAAWGLTQPVTFAGTIDGQIKAHGGGVVTRVTTRRNQGDCCLLSSLPIVAGQYHIPRNGGVYYEIVVETMEGADSIIAIGAACQPYPPYRLPGWNRLSAALHLDDFRKFFEDSLGGRDYTNQLTRVNGGDVVGCGYEFNTGTMFFTHQGRRLPDAFTGIFLPHRKYDVYAALGVSGATGFTVNFGGDSFKWLPGNEWDWRLDRHVGQLTETAPREQEELPSYRA